MIIYTVCGFCRTSQPNLRSHEDDGAEPFLEKIQSGMLTRLVSRTVPAPGSRSKASKSRGKEARVSFLGRVPAGGRRRVSRDAWRAQASNGGKDKSQVGDGVSGDARETKLHSIADCGKAARPPVPPSPSRFGGVLRARFARSRAFSLSDTGRHVLPSRRRRPDKKPTEEAKPTNLAAAPRQVLPEGGEVLLFMGRRLTKPEVPCAGHSFPPCSFRPRFFLFGGFTSSFLWCSFQAADTKG